MPDADFHLTAEFYVASEDFDLDVHGVAALIERRIPTAAIDFERGHLHVVANIDRLKSIGTPETLLRGEYERVDRTICVEIPVPARSEKLLGYTTGFSYYDGCIGFQCTPFEIDALKLGASFVSKSLDLNVSLVSSDNLEIGILFKPGNKTPQALIAERFANLVAVSNTREITHVWQSQLNSACIAWLNDHPEAQTRERWRSVVSDGDALAQSLRSRLTSIGIVRRASVVDFDREFWHTCLVLEYGEWTGMVNLSGHPRPLLKSG